METIDGVTVGETIEVLSPGCGTWIETTVKGFSTVSKYHGPRGFVSEPVILIGESGGFVSVANEGKTWRKMGSTLSLDIAALVAQVRPAGPGFGDGVIAGPPAVLSRLCAWLGFRNPCTKGRVYLTDAKLKRLGIEMCQVCASFGRSCCKRHREVA